MEEYQSVLNKAIDCINNDQLSKAEDYLKSAMFLNVSAPEVHNLLGILFERRGNKLLACKHYRAAYALDPTYKPAVRNLHRVVNGMKDWDNRYDFGDNDPCDDSNNSYVIEYDAQNVGHIRKKIRNR